MPRGSWASGVAVAAALAAVGCFALPKNPAAGTWFDPQYVFGHSAADKIFLQTTLIEVPAGDPYLTRELWVVAGKPIPPERAALLAENGFRVGRFGSSPPAEFLKLVTSDQHTLGASRDTRSPGHEKIIPVNGPLVHTVFAVAAEIGDPPTNYDLTAAECGLAVTPTPADNGRVKLTFEPRVQHGQRQGWIRPTADGTAFTRLDGKPTEVFDRLSWSVTVEPKDCVLVGPTEVPGGKLGGAFFVTTADGRARMRVLVVRAWRAEPPSGPASARRVIAAQASATVR